MTFIKFLVSRPAARCIRLFDELAKPQCCAASGGGRGRVAVAMAMAVDAVVDVAVARGAAWGGGRGRDCGYSYDCGRRRGV